jgi:hypothetical protein
VTCTKGRGGGEELCLLRVVVAKTEEHGDGLLVGTGGRWCG